MSTLVEISHFAGSKIPPSNGSRRCRQPGFRCPLFAFSMQIRRRHGRSLGPFFAVILAFVVVIFLTHVLGLLALLTGLAVLAANDCGALPAVVLPYRVSGRADRGTWPASVAHDIDDDFLDSTFWNLKFARPGLEAGPRGFWLSGRRHWVLDTAARQQQHRHQSRAPGSGAAHPNQWQSIPGSWTMHSKDQSVPRNYFENSLKRVYEVETIRARLRHGKEAPY